MNKKWLPLALVILLGLILFGINRWQNKDKKTNPKVNEENNDPAPGTINRDRGFDRRISYLEYSNHAKCRMECRKISIPEVEEIMQEGKINYNKSDLQNARCPRYAVEGITDDEQRVRIVYAQCNEKTVVVTVIDLDREWSCDCAGDDDNFENKKG